MRKNTQKKIPVLTCISKTAISTVKVHQHVGTDPLTAKKHKTEFRTRTDSRRVIINDRIYQDSFLLNRSPHAREISGLDEQAAKVEVSDDRSPICARKTLVLSTPDFTDNLFCRINLKAAYPRKPK